MMVVRWSFVGSSRLVDDVVDACLSKRYGIGAGIYEGKESRWEHMDDRHSHHQPLICKSNTWTNTPKNNSAWRELNSPTPFGRYTYAAWHAACWVRDVVGFFWQRTMTAAVRPRYEACLHPTAYAIANGLRAALVPYNGSLNCRLSHRAVCLRLSYQSLRAPVLNCQTTPPCLR